MPALSASCMSRKCCPSAFDENILYTLGTQFAKIFYQLSVYQLRLPTAPLDVSMISLHKVLRDLGNGELIAAVD
jgi:hypothetical protein